MQDDNDIFSDFFIQKLKDKFRDIDNGIVYALPDKDKHYADLITQEKELASRFPNLYHWLEDEGPLTLTAEEHSALVEYIDITGQQEDIERLALLYAGANECHEHYKKAGLI